MLHKKKKIILPPYDFERRDPRSHDVVIEILYCGVCHTDIHLKNNDWGISIYPIVPGHEIVGRVIAVGDQVKNLRAAILGALAALLIRVGIVITVTRD